MDAMPAPTPGTGAKFAPVTKANINIVRGVCIMRMASRFCFGKKPVVALVSPLRMENSAAFPSGSLSVQRARAAAKLTSGTSSLSALWSLAVVRSLGRSTRLATAASRTSTSLASSIVHLGKKARLFRLTQRNHRFVCVSGLPPLQRFVQNRAGSFTGQGYTLAQRSGIAIRQQRFLVIRRPLIYVHLATSVVEKGICGSGAAVTRV
jgi:hypothetical protein